MNKRATYFFLEAGILALCLVSIFIPVFYGNILSNGTSRPLMPFILTFVFFSFHIIGYALIFEKLPQYKITLWSFFITLVFAIILWNLAWTEHSFWSDANLTESIDMVSVGESINPGLPVVYKAYNSGAEGRIWVLRNLTIVLLVIFICAYLSSRAIIKKLSKQPEV